jgi:hypothetical protein
MDEEEIPSVEGYEIRAGTRLGEILGFTEELFYGFIEIIDDGRLYLYYISSKDPKMGNTTRLIAKWVKMGFDVHVVRPCPEMQRIITRQGFEEYEEELPHRYRTERHINVWRKRSEQ